MKSFLIVEDNDSLRDIYDKLIRKRFGNAHIDHVGNGRDALKKAKELNYSAIIVDIDIPVMNGVEFFKKLEEDLPLMAKNTVFISGAIMSEENSYILERSRPHLLKPFTAEDFNTLLSLMVSMDEKKFVLTHGKKCTRANVRFRANEDCLVLPLAEDQDICQINCRALNYSIEGILIEHKSDLLHSTEKVQVYMNGFDIKRKKAKVVWTKEINRKLQSGLQWA